MFTDKLLTLAFGLIFLLTLACGDASETESQQAETAPPPVKIISGNAAFLDYAASTNMLQMELGRLAIEKAESEQVKAIGEHALEHHKAALAKLKATVGKDTLVTLPDTLGAADQGIIEEFRSLSGAEFDSRYRQYIISSHTSQLERYQESLLKTEEKDIRNWIREMQEHLQERVQLASKVDTTAKSIEGKVMKP